MIGRVRLGVLCTACAWVAFGTSCRDPTQIAVEVTTDVDCAQVGATSIAVGPVDGLESRAAGTTSATCVDGRIGALVVVPSGDRGEEVAFRIVTGFGGAGPDDCVASGYAGNCIVARRALRFLPHTPLRVPVAMRSACAGKACDTAGVIETCVDGTCVPAQLDPNSCTGAGCDESTLGGAGPGDDGGQPDGGPAPIVAAATAGGQTSCALRASGKTYCWGHDVEGSFGSGTTSGYIQPVSAAMKNVPDVSVLLTAQQFSCALRQSGAVVCAGSNGDGELGNGTTTPSPSPVPVQGLADAIAIGISGNDSEGHACGLRANGAVVCWGRNDFGQVGDGSNINRSTPSPVATAGAARAIGVGHYHSCAVLQSGSVQCWGRNDYGQLGDGVTNAAPVTQPQPVSNLSDAVAVSAGELHTCALRAGGAVACWGSGAYGKLGDGSGTDHHTPVAVASIADATQVSAGYRHTCAVLGGGAAACWGSSGYGELGIGSGGDQAKPATLASLAGVTQISAGWLHTCAALSGGDVYCFGRNTQGEVSGDGRNSTNGGQDSFATPVRVPLP